MFYYYNLFVSSKHLNYKPIAKTMTKTINKLLVTK